MSKRWLVATAFSGLLSLPAADTPRTSPELVSPLGTKLYAQPDEKGVVEEARKKLAAEPNNIDVILALGRAQGSVWRFRETIETYSRGIKLDPSNAMLYRHRGHRYISIRRLRQAVADLEKAAKLDDKKFDIWYHLGLAYYLQGRFAGAAAAYEKCRAVAEKDDSTIAVSHWLYMSYRRQNRPAEAAAVLERITPSMKVEENRSYFDLLLFYKGLKKEEEIFRPDKMTDLEMGTTGYGVANWRLYNGDQPAAREMFRRIVSGKAWSAFGFIAAEAELVRGR